MEKRDLQEWANDNGPAENMVYYNSWWNQVMFVRDTIGILLR